MDFELNEDQRILQKSARDFLKKEYPRALVRILADSEKGYSPELWKKMAALGWMGLFVPEEYDGIGWSFVEQAVLLEEMGYALCPAPFISTTILGAQTLLMAGNEEQKRDILPNVVAGDLILTMALTESDGGCEPSALNLMAVREGGEWVLNGIKLFVPDALAADYILCVARTSKDPIPGKGLTIFLVEAKTMGVNVTPLKTISKDKQYEISFSNVCLKPESIIGPVDGAWPTINAIINMAGLARAAETVGVMRAVLNMTVAYAKERVQFGRPIGSFQAIQHYLADMWVDTLGARSLVMKAAWKLATGRPSDEATGMAKVMVGKAGRKVTTTGHRIFGAIGFTMEHDLHLYHRRALANDPTFGNSDFHYEQIAGGLGL
ncbi:MAG: acyl-CoA/acyl-ACP dehydrogenase [Desulfobacteraceae bacterium]|nr:acyl-CoA/acyl-ACP dehydrogenase [Desulfobacteraceae bacterium]